MPHRSPRSSILRNWSSAKKLADRLLAGILNNLHLAYHCRYQKSVKSSICSECAIKHCVVSQVLICLPNDEDRPAQTSEYKFSENHPERTPVLKQAGGFGQLLILKGFSSSEPLSSLNSAALGLTTKLQHPRRTLQRVTEAVVRASWQYYSYNGPELQCSLHRYLYVSISPNQP